MSGYKSKKLVLGRGARLLLVFLALLALPTPALAYIGPGAGFALVSSFAVILITIVVVLGPLIRRFGIVLTLEVFRSNRATSERFLALLDIAYYLVFSAFILMSTNFSAQADWGGTLAGQLGGDGELFRIAGLLLVMGILHTVTIAVLPVMGLIFASNWRRAARTQLGKEAPEPDPQAEKADRVATLIVWLVTAAMALLFIVPGIIGAILGAE